MLNNANKIKVLLKTKPIQTRHLFKNEVMQAPKQDFMLVVQDVVVLVLAGLCLASLVAVQPKFAVLCWAWLYLLLSLFYEVEQGLAFCVVMASVTCSIMSTKALFESPKVALRVLGAVVLLANMTTIARAYSTSSSQDEAKQSYTNNTKLGQTKKALK